MNKKDSKKTKKAIESVEPIESMEAMESKKAMDLLERKLRAYGKRNRMEPEEERIEETVRSVQRIYDEYAGHRVTSYFEFIYEQSGYIRKRWWGLQFLLLLYLGCIIRTAYVQRVMGVASSLFVIMIIPELWKNRSSNSLEIEGASYYTLRQIYTARMLAFAAVDGLLLSIFTGLLSLTYTVGFRAIIIQFFLPMIVTCCICMRTLCSRYIASEYVACLLSCMWTAVWLLLVSREDSYRILSGPVGIGIFCIMILYLTYAVKRVMYENGNIWENVYEEGV